MTDQQRVGTVYLVGGGPGDPGLITVKGLDILRHADVVLYDRLIPKELLAEARPDAELVDVGKPSHKPHHVNQDMIIEIMLNKAREGRTVVRLKGGDPFVFGRGGEEAIACQAAGIPWVVVPGVSSAIAVPAAAGIPVTHRNVSTMFTVFAGYEDPTKGDSHIDYHTLAHVARTGTLVLLMGASRLPQIVEQLIAAGADPHIPAACIEWGTTDQQRVVIGTLAELPQLTADARIGPPATTIIGAVTNLRAMLLGVDAP